MAWEELIKQQNAQAQGAPPPQEAQRPDRGSLIQQAGGMIDREAAEPPAEEAEAPREPVRLRDGYVRRSPVQPYLTAADYGRRRNRRIALIVVGIGVALLVLLALMKSGFLMFRFR